MEREGDKDGGEYRFITSMYTLEAKRQRNAYSTT
jgi:hypothetical protein